MRDLEFEEKLSKARAEADAANERARKNQKPWDIEIDHHDVDEATAKGFKTRKPVMAKAPGITVYVDGKKAESVYIVGGGNVLSTFMPKAKKGKK